MNPVVPAPDILPLPGPVWLFKTLLHLTFVIHLLFMNFTLGGAVLAAVSRLRRHDEGKRLARWIETKLPTALAMTVVFGVAPLLFVQVLYGNLLYTSSILIAWPWWLVIPVLIVAYYAAYALAFRGDRFSWAFHALGWLVLLGLLYISHVFVHNMSLVLRPESWSAIYHADPSGMNSNYSDPSLWPRYLHFLLAAIAVCGLMIAWEGAQRVKRDKADGRYRLRFGAMWFLIPTGLQYLVGTWFLLSLPRDVIMTFMGQSIGGTVAFIASIILPLGALMTVAMAIRHPQPQRLMNVAAAHLLGTLVAMVIVRDTVRDRLLAPVFKLSDLKVESQTGVLLLFIVLLLVGLGTVAWMLRLYSTRSSSSSAP